MLADGLASKTFKYIVEPFGEPCCFIFRHRADISINHIESSFHLGDLCAQWQVVEILREMTNYPDWITRDGNVAPIIGISFPCFYKISSPV